MKLFFYNFIHSGVRIAYSALGSVTSLNGEPESGITVEALGIAKSGSDCDQLQEEAVTESTGENEVELECTTRKLKLSLLNL